MRNTEKKSTTKKFSIKQEKQEILNKVTHKQMQKTSKKTEFENFKDKSMMNRSENSKVSKEEVMENCRKVFYNFAKFSPEEKDFFLSQQSLIKILKAVGLFKEKLIKLPEIDIIIKKINNNSTRLTMKDFTNFIAKISTKIYLATSSTNIKQSIDKKDAMSNIIRNYFEPFAKYIQEKTINKEDDPMMPVTNIFYHGEIEQKIISFQMEDEDISLLQSVSAGVKEIYNNYFHPDKFNNLDNDKAYSLSLNNIIDFGKEFEILPLQCGINQLVVIFNNIVHSLNVENITKNRNNPVIYEESDSKLNVLSLNKFTMLLVHLSIMSFDKNNHKDINDNFKNYEKILLFFEKLEHSKGFENLQHKNFKFNHHISLIPKKDFSNVLREQKFERKDSPTKSIKTEIENERG